MSKNKKTYFITLLIFFLILSSIAIFVYCKDPYQQFRTSNKFVGNQRLVNPGMAMNSNYDAVITGSSMAMNIYPHQIDSLFGWNSINLTIMGATSYDYKYLFGVIENKKKAKNIILSFDFFSFFRKKIPLETYLYDSNRINDYKYLLNLNSLIDAFKISEVKPTSKNEIYHFSSSTGKDKPLKEYFKLIGKKAETPRIPVSFENMYMKFKEDYLPFIQNNRYITFYIFYPPYSILEFKRAMLTGEFKEWVKFKQLSINDLLKFKNVKLFDFQYLDGITMNLSDYMDITHHSQATSRYLVKLIAKDSCRVTRDNYIKNIKLLQVQVTKYIVPALR